MGSVNNEEKTLIEPQRLLRKNTWHPEVDDSEVPPSVFPEYPVHKAIQKTSDSFRKRNYSAGDYVIAPLGGEREGSSLTHSWTFQPGKHNQRLYSDNFQEAQRQWKRLQEWGEVKETKKIRKRFDRFSGRKYINHYEIIKELGRGMHGKVKLGRDTVTRELLAIKIIPKTERRPKLGRANASSQKEKVRREIAILKKCVHPNVVRLREVIDDPSSTKVYLVLEYMSGGEVPWTDCDSPVLSISEARQYFRDVVLGLEYLHYQGIIHRDIKPANLLLNSSNCVKISDFGVSYIANAGLNEDNDVELAKTVGTPAFFAPELCWTDLDRPRPKISEAIDVWALGVTLFCLLFGRCPFNASMEYELFDKIVNEPLNIPSTPDIGEEGRDLLKRLLCKDPEQRITLVEVKLHPWTLNGLKDPEKWLQNTDPSTVSRVEVSTDEVASAISLVGRLRRKLGKLFRFRRPKARVFDSSSSVPSDSSICRPESSGNSSIGLSASELSDSFNRLAVNESQKDRERKQVHPVEMGRNSSEKKPRCDFGWDYEAFPNDNQDADDACSYNTGDSIPQVSKSINGHFETYSRTSMDTDDVASFQSPNAKHEESGMPVVTFRNYENYDANPSNFHPVVPGFVSSPNLHLAGGSDTPIYCIEHSFTPTN
ncbi:Serine/threonine-protein kinase ssp1 [Schizosaccharomyces pombe]